jgi:hypothetical protein
MVYETKKQLIKVFPLIGVVFKDYNVPKVRGEDASRVKMVSIWIYLPRPQPSSLHMRKVFHDTFTTHQI